MVMSKVIYPRPPAPRRVSVAEAKARFSSLLRETERGRTIKVDLEDLGFKGPCEVRDLWRGRSLGRFREAFETLIPGHGAGLYRLSPVR